MHPSGRVYTRFTLFLYDFFVLRFSNSFAWRCPLNRALEPHFLRHIGAGAQQFPDDKADNPKSQSATEKRSKSHLDVGVGTGHYLAVAARTGHLRAVDKVVLLDLNPITLVTAKKRLQDAGYAGEIELVEGDVLANWDTFPPSLKHPDHKFHSISLYYLLHCLPGSMSEKASKVFSNMKRIMVEEGCVYGATILGKTHAPHNILGRTLLGVYNRKGIFSNENDSKESLEGALREHFRVVEVTVVGNVALFSARGPILHDEAQ
ncbi:S-adenosyl-L-methionine dependent methyltransferase [Panus rudis PR-1116 ss-1]|nr:S-adenosyl-L-methionine dependent methyltransferase [Panus rudis PR-1116 ss-1]